jgi:hypothetical protein
MVDPRRVQKGSPPGTPRGDHHTGPPLGTLWDHNGGIPFVGPIGEQSCGTTLGDNWPTPFVEPPLRDPVQVPRGKRLPGDPLGGPQRGGPPWEPLGETAL